MGPVVTESSRFRRSVNVERDITDPSSLEGYIVSPLARDVLLRVIKAVAASGGQRAFSLVGPYGTGKSAFVVFLLKMLSAKGTRAAALDAYSASFARQRSMVEEQLGSGFVPVVITGHRGELRLAVLAAVRAACSARWPANLPPKVAQAFGHVEVAEREGRVLDSGLAFLTTVVADAVKADGGQGIVIVVDECGKFLESAAAQGKAADLYLLQVLAETAAREDGGRILLLTVLHQDFDAYAGGLPPSARQEWTKVHGRFEVMPFLESPGHLVSLVGSAIRMSPLAPQQGLFASQHEGASQARELAGMLPADLAVMPNALSAVYPLHPLAGLCLGPIFRTSVGQNERSVFAFLSSAEPFGFQAFLAERRESELYYLDRLWDYIQANTSPSLRQARARVLTAADDALLRLPRDAKVEDGRVLKALSLLQLVQAALPLTVDPRLLGPALGLPAEVVQASLERLKHGSLIVYRRYRRAWQLWEGSDVDIEALLVRYRELVQNEGGLASVVQRELPPLPVVGARHAHETGTLRFLRTRYVTPAEALVAKSSPGGDGDLLLIVPDRADELVGLASKLSARVMRGKERPVVFALPQEAGDLIEWASDFRALERISKEEHALESDRVAKRELADRKESVSEGLRVALAKAFAPRRGAGGLQWIVLGDSIPKDVRDRPSAVASAVFDEVFTHAPWIRNELVNRQALSPAAASARRELVVRLASNSGDEQLGISGSPPELSMYRSVLRSTGIHHRAPDGTWQLQPPTDHRLKKVWKELDHRLGRRRMKADDLVSVLAEPPFGIRAGLAGLLVVVWFYEKQRSIFYYEDGTFVPQVGVENLEMLIRRPTACELQYAGGHEANAVMKAVAAALGATAPGREPSALDLARYVVGMVRRLSNWASTTARVSEDAKRVRVAVKSTKDPLKLLMRELPFAVGAVTAEGVDVEPEGADVYGARLRAALGSLQKADQQLLADIESTLRGFFKESDGLEFFASVRRRAEVLVAAGGSSPAVDRWAQITAALTPNDPESREEWLRHMGTSVIGKPPPSWTDGDAAQFPYSAMELCRKVLASEELALERGFHANADFRLVRVAVLDSEGREQTGVAVVRPAERAQVSKVLKEFDRLVGGSVSGEQGLAAAVIAELMDRLATKRPPEVS